VGRERIVTPWPDRDEESEMKLAFMSSVCPKLSLAELISTGAEYGYVGIEFRPEWGHAHGIELEASAAQRKEAAKTLTDSELIGCCLSPGVHFGHGQSYSHAEAVETVTRYVGLAAETGIGRIRLFGCPLPNTGARARTASYQAQADALAVAAERAGEAGVVLAVETHSNFRALDADEVMYRAGYPAALRINWHLGHCIRHGEDVDEAYRHIKGRIAHVHWGLPSADSEKDNPTRRVHLERQIELLLADGFDGYFAVEVINPDDPLEVLRRHADAWAEFRKKFGF